LCWPERFPETEVAQLEKEMGPYAVAGQLQQSPAPRGGGIIKIDWWQPWESRTTPPLDYIVASLDTAMTEKDSSDYSALVIFGVWNDSGSIVDNGMGGYDFVASNEPNGERARVPVTSGSLPKVLMIHAWKDRLDLPALYERVLASCLRFKVDSLVIENKAHGHAVMQTLRQMSSSKPFNVIMFDPKRYGDKSARLYAIQHLFSEGLIYAPIEKAWAEMVITQVSQFPRGANDDLVDCVSMGLQMLRQRGFTPRREEAVASIMGNVTHKTKQKALYPV
jgi:predicted phage terminase large subunit-like protein